jgi:peptidyl-prolyl cis-trans isomerase A (cyclophilin A)
MKNQEYSISVLAGIFIVLLVAAFFFGPHTQHAKETPFPEEAEGEPAQEEEPAPQEETAPEEGACEMPVEEDSMNEIAVIETSKGTIEIELDRENAPITVENFVTYANEGFYDGTVFHRVIPGFMVQGGGFALEGPEKETRPPISLESNNGLKNLRGTIAMARTMDPDSATSQFFINTADNSFLDYAPGNDGYAVFGKVISGMDVVGFIESVETADRGMHGDWPVEDVVITRIYIKQE